MSSHAILATVCRSCRPLAARGCKTCLPLAEKCHGYIYIPGSTARGLVALGKGSKVGYGLPRNNAASLQRINYLAIGPAIGTANAANEARHIWRRHTRDKIAATAKGALNEIGGGGRT